MSDRPQLTADRLRSLLTYNPETGEMRWIVSGHGRRTDRQCGFVCRFGYAKTKVDGRAYFNHRLAWLFVYGAFPLGDIDHIDGDKLNNRISNLRDVDRSTNLENQRKPWKKNKAMLLGVSSHGSKGRFQAQIQVRGIKTYLGLYDTPELAHSAYLSAKRMMHEGSTL